MNSSHALFCVFFVHLVIMKTFAMNFGENPFEITAFRMLSSCYFQLIGHTVGFSRNTVHFTANTVQMRLNTVQMRLNTVQITLFTSEK
ncbi:hypothetical protein BCM40_00855 [Planococcus donghaensis]|uniref:Uncharacterized protein n=1 Tax=Planococcus donghaensis TaxID=414778 RepID=A0A1C7EDL5_9BACL|nr:hypothetical protein BCM40_00855 [Planococcus donghaensis]